MSDHEQGSVDDESMDGEAFDTGIFDADQIVSEFESQVGSGAREDSASAWQRVENLLERRRLRESLRDLYDDDFMDDE